MEKGTTPVTDRSAWNGKDWSDSARKRYLERIWRCSRPERTFVLGFADLHGPNSLIRGIPSVPSEVLAACGHAVSAY